MDNSKTSVRNYQLDFLKLCFALCVYIYHSRLLSAEGHIIRFISKKWGFMSVHFFFLVSGMFMISSFMRNRENQNRNHGHESGKYVIKKYLSVAFPYYSAFITSFSARMIMEIGGKGKPVLNTLGETLIKSIPELLMIQNAGVSPVEINDATWYISAMLITMLFMNYLLRRNPDLYINILTPLAGILLLGFFYRSGEPSYPHKGIVGFVSAGILRAVCGISFGSVAYIISEFLKKRVSTKNQRIFVTVSELILSLLFAVVWFWRTMNSQFWYPVIMLMPVIVGIIFSGTSYIGCIFRSRIFSRCGNWSLIIYLNHFAPYRIVQQMKIFSEYDYGGKLGFMTLFTAVSCVISFFLIKLFRFSAVRINKWLSYQKPV
ncbi:MAG: acyltransferase [Ruminococcus sp.]|nr:acyltransferase [Ruminococcus sp.]